MSTKMDAALAAKVTALAAVLNEREQAKQASKPEDNPYANHTLKDLSHGLRKGADNLPAMLMVNTDAALSMEGARIAAAKEGKEDKANKRKAQARARAARKVEFDRIAESPVRPDQKRMDQAWLVVFWLVPIITKIAKSKQRWANRLLGSNADDIPQMALEKTALVLAKQSKWDLEVLRVAAEQLNKSERGIPGDQTVDETEPAEKKQIRKARKWLMGMVNNRVMGAVVDSYTSQNNLRWDNIDLIATIMATINGPGDDAMLARFKADRAPAFLGTRFQRPDGINPDALAMAITGAITAKGLDPLVEFLLNDDNRRVDGAVEWTKHAKAIFLLTPGGNGERLWDAECEATKNHARRDNVRGKAAMQHVRDQFAWLPGLIAEVIESFDPHFIGWSSVGRRAVMASDFELFYLPDAPEQRGVLAPALKYASVEEAAQALIEHLANLKTWEDMVTE